MSDLRCWFTEGGNPHHPDPKWYTEYSKALCEPCFRWYSKQLAKRAHPAGKAVPNLPPLDMRRCYSHNREDKLSCPECVAYAEDRSVFLND